MMKRFTTTGGRGSSEEYVLSEPQLEKLWASCDNNVDRVIIGCLAYMGIRASELAHLKPKWIREEAIHIPARQDCDCFECRARKGYWTPKSKAGARTLAIPGFLKPILSEFVRHHPNGIGLSRRSIWYRVQRLLEKADLGPGHCHSLRATAATLLASKGFSAVELCQYMGWSRISVGESYVRLAEAKKSTAEKIRKIYG